jgi:prepilin-type N-terminal cleavage/methylation domain-containing protein
MNKRGFTLIELLVVIAVIGLLASIVLVAVNNTRIKARNIRRRSDIKQLQLAVEMYYDDNNGTYPLSCRGSGNWGGHCPTFGNCDTNYIVGITSYITSLPIDPGFDVAGQCYLYISDRVDYKIIAHATMEGSCPPMESGDSMWDPARSPTQCTIGVYTPGASAW